MPRFADWAENGLTIVALKEPQGPFLHIVVNNLWLCQVHACLLSKTEAFNPFWQAWPCEIHGIVTYQWALWFQRSASWFYFNDLWSKQRSRWMIQLVKKWGGGSTQPRSTPSGVRCFEIWRMITRIARWSEHYVTRLFMELSQPFFNFVNIFSKIKHKWRSEAKKGICSFASQYLKF